MKRLFGLAIVATLLIISSCAEALTLPSGATRNADVAYGSDPLQKMDVYTPKGVLRAPVIFMVHGGGWVEGDKANYNVIANKVPYFLGKGFVFVSVNYRLSPQVNPLSQAKDVAAALAWFQQHASSYRANADKIVLMGHSAGGNLVALVASVPSYAQQAGAKPVIGTVVLDSAAYDVPAIMAKPHPALYDAVFAHHPLLQRLASPTLQISGTPGPMLLVCDTDRDNACDQATPFAAKTGGQVYPIAMAHRDINLDVGLPDALTARIAQFLGMLKAN